MDSTSKETIPAGKIRNILVMKEKQNPLSDVNITNGELLFFQDFYCRVWNSSRREILVSCYNGYFNRTRTSGNTDYRRWNLRVRSQTVQRSGYAIVE